MDNATLTMTFAFLTAALATILAFLSHRQAAQVAAAAATAAAAAAVTAAATVKNTDTLDAAWRALIDKQNQGSIDDRAELHKAQTALRLAVEQYAAPLLPRRPEPPAVPLG